MFRKFVSLKIIPLRSLRLCGELLLFLLCVASLVIPCCAASASTWHIESVVVQKGVEQSSIKVDAGGNVHIAYGGDHLYYATYNGSEWSYQTVDSNSGVGSYPSLALDSSGKAHISYYDGTNGYLKYATNASGSWITTTVDSSETVGLYTSISLDSSGKAHISYYDGTNGYLKYATNASGSWVTTTVDSSETVGLYTSINLDSSGKVHIGYYDDTNRDLKYATNASGLWVTTTVDSDGDVGQYTSIALDSNDKVHISYYDETNSDLKYATNATGSWVTTTVDNSGEVGYSTSITLDGSGKVHISYRYSYYCPFTVPYPDTQYSGTCSALKYANNANASGLWVTTTVDSNEDSHTSRDLGSPTSIVADSAGKIHISYYFGNKTGNDLKYATNVSGSWIVTIIDSKGYANSEYHSIAVDSKGKIHISYQDWLTYNLMYITNSSGSWVTTTVDSTGFTGEYNSIALDKSGKAHISYYEYYNENLMYATNATGKWITKTIDHKGKVGVYTSIALDSNGKVHISYYEYKGKDDRINGNLKYATNATGKWVKKGIDSNIDYAWSSISLDNKNNAHIAYYAEIKGSPNIRYATNASGDWKTETVDRGGDVDGNSMMALDNKGNAHISYISNSKLKYTTNTSGKWIKKTVDSKGQCENTSIAIDDSGNAHISYNEYANDRDLKYATNISGKWVTETVDSGEYIAWKNSIALDVSGNAHISYIGGTYGKLKYATNAPGFADTDTTAPAGSISIIGEDYTNTTSISLILTATDEKGVTGGYLSESPSTPSASASGWAAVTKTQNYSGSALFTLSGGDGQKNIYAWFKDEAGNVSTTASASITLVTTDGQATPTTTPSPTPTPATSPTPVTSPSPTPTPTSTDTTAPSGSVNINSGATYAKSTTVTLTLSATDTVGVTGYYLSTTSSSPSISASGWTTITSTTSYSGSVSYTLTSGDGVKTLYVWFKDAAGNVSSTASDTITLDTTSPTVAITSPTSDSTYTTKSGLVSLGGSASDDTSGVSGVTWSNNRGGSGTASSTTSWTISNVSLSSGDNVITVTATDNAGNTATDTIMVTYTGTTTITPTPATTPSPAVSPSPAASPSPTPTATPTPTPAAGGSGIVFGFVRNAEMVQMREVTVTISSITGYSASAETSIYGMYKFSDLAAGSYTLTYEREGYQAQTVSVSLDDGEIKEIDDIIMEEVVRGKIWGYVYDVKGNPVEFVRLKLEGMETGLSESDSTDKEGYFIFTDLEVDTYTIIAKKKRYRQATKTVTIEEGESKEIEIEMRGTTKRIKKLHSAAFGSGF